MEPLTRNIVTIAAELFAIIAVFDLIAWIAGSIIGVFLSSPKLDGIGGFVFGKLRLLYLLAGFLTCLVVGAWNGYLAYLGEDLPTYTLDKVQNVPRGVWLQLAVGAAKVLALAAGIAVLLWIIRSILHLFCVRAKAYEGIRANDESIEQFFGELGRTIRRGAWLGFLVLSAMLLDVPLPIRTVTKVKPGAHQQVARDVRRLIKESFDEYGIEIPYARRVLILDQPDQRVSFRSVQDTQDTLCGVALGSRTRTIVLSGCLI